MDGAGRLPGRRLVTVDRGVVECGRESRTGRGGGQRGGSVGQVEEGGGGEEERGGLRVVWGGRLIARGGGGSLVGGRGAGAVGMGSGRVAVDWWGRGVHWRGPTVGPWRHRVGLPVVLQVLGVGVRGGVEVGGVLPRVARLRRHPRGHLPLDAGAGRKVGPHLRHTAGRGLWLRPVDVGVLVEKVVAVAVGGELVLGGPAQCGLQAREEGTQRGEEK